MDNGKKTASASQNVLNVLLVIVCCSIFGLFIYDYIRKNNELSAYKDRAAVMAEEKDKQLKKIEGMANLYKDTAYSNVTEGIIPSEESEKIKKQIAANVASNLAPLLNKVGKDQDITLKKIDQIQGELIELLEQETKKSQMIRKELSKAVKAERAKQDKLQKNLTATQKVVGDLNGLAGELKAQYLAAHEEDSAMGDIARAASAPAKFVTNTFTFDWFVARDKRSEQRKYDRIQRKIMAYYEAIGTPAMMRLKTARQAKAKAKARAKARAKGKVKPRKKKVSEPEIIK